MKTKVFKFGGASNKKEVLQDPIFVKMLQKEASNNTLFTVSALEGVTRLLRLIFDSKIERLNKEFKDLIIHLSVNEFDRIHKDLIDSMFSGVEKHKVNIKFEEVKDSLISDLNGYKKDDSEEQFYASLVKHGELASSSIFNSYLCSIGIESELLDARDFLTTDSNFKEAKILEVNPALKKIFPRKTGVRVIQGFIARDSQGHDTVLGFDGSDLSASYFAVELGALLTYWKNVDGFYQKDPSLFPSQKDVRRRMSISEYEELPTHPIRLDSVKHAVENGIVVHMRSFLHPKGVDARIYA
ncbi:MAG TPA: hypothetical protein PKZ36_02750 [Candidatus Paceibacterota bacterium]|nr:hypothetical protein [Candidatus Paceibacterota bacterium]HPT18298.1 hypothetical protein [Candidatus Paceibacterota bacterium]